MLLAFLALVLGYWTYRTYLAGPPPNVAVFLIDTLRPDHLGIHGYKKETAPFLSEIAEESAVFDRAFSTSSWTAPATASLFTSAYPHKHGVTEGFRVNRKRAARLKKRGMETIELHRIADDLPTLPELFKNSGYTTFGMSANINIAEEMGFDRGFDRFEFADMATADVFLERMREWKPEIEASGPYFLYLQFIDPHMPYHLREPYYEEGERTRLEELRARYLSEIGYLDANIQEIYELLNLRENTVFVVVTDHGEEFMDHGHLRHGPRLYDELHRVLMMIRAPSLGIKGQRIALNVSLIDVLPTLVDLIGGKPIPKTAGVSLVPLIKRNRQAESLMTKLKNRTLFAHRMGYEGLRGTQAWAAVYQHWKMILWRNSRMELYDHRNDLQEKNNLFGKVKNRRVSTLGAKLRKFRTRSQTHETSAKKIQIDLDEERLKTLKSMGYVK